MTTESLPATSPLLCCSTFLVVVAAVLAPGCSPSPRPQATATRAASENWPFVGVDLDALPERDRSILTRAGEDFRAVLEGRDPVHATRDREAPVPADGGTNYFKGEGYDLTVLSSLSSFGAVRGKVYGPIITFDDEFAPGNSQSVSGTRFYTADAISDLLADK